MNLKKYLSFSFLFIVAFSMAQVNAFKSGEKLTYAVSYEMSGLMTSIAQIDMQVNGLRTKKGNLFQLKANAKTYKNYDNFFKIRDLYESYVYQKSLRPVSYHRHINEGGHFKRVKNFYNHGAGTATVKIEKKNNHKEQKKITIPKNINDVLSALYYIRAINLNGLKSENRLKLKMIFDGKVRPISLLYKGKETKSSRALGRKECHKFSLVFNGRNSFSGTIWLTADKNKVPVLIETRIPIGRGKIELTRAVGLNK